MNFINHTNSAESSLGLVVAAVLSSALVGGILYFRKRSRPRKAKISKGSLTTSRFFRFSRMV